MYVSNSQKVVNIMKSALITGVTGQDGSYLAELLLKKGYEVHGLRRNQSAYNNDRILTIVANKNFYLHSGDLTETSSITSIIKETDPDEIYNLAAQSHVKVSFETPEFTSNTDALGALRILDSIRMLEKIRKIRFYQAGSSEMFGKVQTVPQNENTAFYPRSPYGVSKVYAYWITKNYRESYGIFATNGILFNHESPRRGDDFVTQKIVKGMAAIVNGSDMPVSLGNLEAKRDWGHAKDYVRAMWMMLQQAEPDDYVIAMEEQHSIKEFIALCADFFGFNLRWSGVGLNEKAVDIKTGKTIIRIDERFFRPAEVDSLMGDCTKAKNAFGWKPKYNFTDLVFDMCQSEIDNYKVRNVQ